MAKHGKPEVGNPPADLRRRVDKARSEKRFQTALDLAKQLYKYAPTPENRDLFFRVHLGRAAQLRDQGATRDACTVLENAVPLVENDPSKLLALAEEVVSCGEIKRALALIDRLPEPKPTAKLLATGADAALRKGAQGRTSLPESMHADFDRVRAAFVHLAAGQDDQVKESLQAIGLSSPFLEWKVLLRGFLAYHQHDDTRALENWSRLDPARFPARLAAPFRFQIDPAFQTAQPPETQAALRQQADRLQGDALVAGLGAIQSHFLKNQGLRAAFREAELVLPIVRQRSPKLEAKLANCFYWEVINQGDPQDSQRYQRMFGKPADDQKFSRMGALVTESMPAYADAHALWQDYEKEISANPTLWPGPENDRARAMVWFRMGANAKKQDDVVRAIDDVPFSPFGIRPEKPRRLEPSAEKCYRRAAELAPDWDEPAVALFELYREREATGKALDAGRALLKRFPDHQPTLEAMADLLREQGDFAAATAMLEQALSANPLHRGLRQHLGDTRRNLGAQRTLEGKLDEAREAFQSAAALLDARHLFPVQCQWAACEFKAGDAVRAEELVRKAAADPADGPAAAAYLYAQAVTLKLPKTIKARFEQQFKAQLADPPAPAAATALCGLFARFQADGFTYHGGKTHQKKVVQLAEKTHPGEYTEDQMERMGAALLALGAVRAVQRLTGRWRTRFPKSPFPVFFEMESHLKGHEERWPLWRLGPLGQQAKQLAEKLPPDDKRDRLIKAIDERLQQFRDLNPFASMFETLMDQFGPEDGPDGEWDEEDRGW